MKREELDKYLDECADTKTKLIDYANAVEEADEELAALLRKAESLLPSKHMTCDECLLRILTNYHVRLGSHGEVYLHEDCLDKWLARSR